MPRIGCSVSPPGTVLVFVLTALALLLVAPSAFATCTNAPRLEGKLHFLSNRPGGDRDGNWDVYRANIDGSGVQRVTDFARHSIRWFDYDRRSRSLVVAGSTRGRLSVGPSGNDGGPATAEEMIAVVSRDGSTRVLLNVLDRSLNPQGFNSVWHPTFSPDGRRIVFAASRRRESNNLWIINRDGSGLRALDRDPHHTQNDPRFGANGRVVFVRHDARGLGQIANPAGLDTWMIDPDRGSGANRLSNEAAIPGPPRAETDPALSPNCEWVAVNRIQSLSRNANVVMRADGRSTGFVEVINSRQAGGFVGVPTWINNQQLLSYRWDRRANGWRIIMLDLRQPGKFRQLTLGAPQGYRDLMPLAY